MSDYFQKSSGKDKDGNEITVYWHGELLCLNPREHYMNTRSYDDMKREYDLLHANEISEEDIMKLATMNRSSTNLILPIIFIVYVPILAFLLYFGYLMLHG